jgi:hypothetical protein
MTDYIIKLDGATMIKLNEQLNIMKETHNVDWEPADMIRYLLDIRERVLRKQKGV